MFREASLAVWGETMRCWSTYQPAFRGDRLSVASILSVSQIPNK
jgi:hypothetical protein